MKRGFSSVLASMACFAAAHNLAAQTPKGANAPVSAPNKPAITLPSPDSNPFPEDTSTVPVMPSASVPVMAGPNSATGFGNGVADSPGDDSDPVRSPDDVIPEASSRDEGFSSSLNGLEKVLPPPDDEEPGKKGKMSVKEPTHKEVPSTDINVGGYYLEKKNWKAALSRFESAMVLDPENPEVYWGLAEADYHLGNFAEARDYYLKLLDYDPDGPHGKGARKALKDPAVANAKTPVASSNAAEPPK